MAKTTKTKLTKSGSWICSPAVVATYTLTHITKTRNHMFIYGNGHYIYIRVYRCTSRSIKEHDRLVIAGYVDGKVRKHASGIKSPSSFWRRHVVIAGIASFFPEGWWQCQRCWNGRKAHVESWSKPFGHSKTRSPKNWEALPPTKFSSCLQRMLAR